jgi:multiple sugar transport system substrate-binding protein
VRASWRRPAAIIAGILVLGLVLAACGGSSNKSSSGSSSSTAAKKPVTLTLWVMNNGPQPVKDTQQIVAPFTAKTGIKVNVQLVGWDVQFDRIRNAAVSGTGPDVTQAGTTQVPFFAALGGFNDLSKYTDQIGGQSAYAPGVWATSQVQGKPGVWGIPWFTEARSIYYRKDALKKAGVDPATAFTTWDAFKSTLEKLKGVTAIGGKPIKPFGYPGKKAFDTVHNIMPFVWDAGGSELSSDSKKSTIASTQAQQGVGFLAQLLPEGLFDKSMLERDGQQVENAFKGGRLATWIGGPWVLASVKRNDDTTWSPAARANVGVAPMPAGPSGKAYTFIGGSNLMVFKSSKHPDEAFQLIKYLSQDSVQKQYADLMGMFPARLAPQKQEGTVDADHANFYKAIQTGRSYAPIPQWAQVENAYKTAFGTVFDQAASEKTYNPAATAKTLQAAQKEADGLLAQATG